MRTTFAVLAVVGCVSLFVGCDDSSKSAAPASGSAATVPSSAPVASTAAPAPKAPLADLIAKTLTAHTAAVNAHDATAVAALYAATAKVVQPGFPDTVGRDAITADTKRTLTVYPDFKIAVVRTFAKDHTVVSQWVGAGKNDGPRMGKPATGRPVGIAGASVLTFDDDGLIKEEHRYFDFPTIQSQLDATAKPGTFRAVVALPTAAAEPHAPKGTPDEAAVLSQVNALYAAFEGKKESDVLASCTEDTTVDDYTMPATAKGLKPIKAWLDGFYTAMPDLAQTKPLQFAADGFVVSEGIMTGTQMGPLGPSKASNKPVSVHFLDVFQMKDGKVVHFDTYGNMAEMLVEIGAMPQPGAAPSASAAPSAAAPSTPSTATKPN